MREYVLAVDMGSTWCKAAYLNRQGRIIAEGRSFTRDIQPTEHQTLEAFWGAFCDAVCAAGRNLDCPMQPAAIAISCRNLVGVAINHDGQESLPAWDYGALKHSPEVIRAYSTDVWGKQDPFAYGYAVRFGGLLHRLKEERPTAWRNIRLTGALRDYLVYRMTGEWVTDPTTGPGLNEWPPEIVTLSGLPHSAFPKVDEPWQIAGGLTATAASALAFEPGIPVAVGLHDGAAANLGLRAVDTGDACLTLGTNFVFRAVTGARLTSGCFSYLIVPEQWAWVNNVPTAAPQLDLVAEILYAEGTDIGQRHHQLGLLADTVPAGADGLTISRVILPQQAEALTQSVQEAQNAGYAKGAIYRAMLESIAFGVLALVERAKQDGAKPRRFVATGGASHNRSLLKVLASVLNQPIEIGYAEAGVMGAGITAAVAARWYISVDDAMNAMTLSGPVVQPDEEAAAFYRGLVSQRE
ncbi:hypothetical protein GC175_05120 [bacterium]|nr:hypothetical protein [bacterium]